MILWGPPGCGKTTLALLLAHYADADFRAISAVLSGLPEVRQVLASRATLAEGRRTVLFVDEVHRFNKAQQDAFLPHIERGTIIFVGATTENPSFELNWPCCRAAACMCLRRCRPTTSCRPCNAHSMMRTRAGRIPPEVSGGPA
jgi:replication-associated recombination protein RarA